MNTQTSFAGLFKKYRLRSEFETLREFTDALVVEGRIYDESLFSHWQKGTRIPKNRNLLIDVLKIFIRRNALSSIHEANEFLQACGQGFLTNQEVSDLISIGKLDKSYFSGLTEYLWTTEKTLTFEKNAKSIWVATPDFYWDIKDYFWSKVILENIIKGSMKYYYMYNDTKENRENLKNIMGRITKVVKDDWNKRIHYVPISFSIFLHVEHVLYDPYDPLREHYIIIDPMGNKTNIDGFNVELKPSLRFIFREQFRKIWNRKVRDPYWKIS